MEPEKNLNNIKRANRKYSLLLSILTILIIIISIIMAIFPSASTIKPLAVILILLVGSLLFMTYRFSKIANAKYKNDSDTPFWIPRTFGYGVAINPYHKTGKYIIIFLMYAIFIFFAGLMILTLFM